jgi:uncharacterized protein
MTNSQPPSSDPARLQQVLDNYATLCAWCDGFFAGVHKAQKQHMQCGPGCATCCTLTTVTALEAHAIREYLEQHPDVPERIAACPPGTRAGAPAIDREMCPLLLHRECSIYPARPVICRTHGLPVRHRGVGIMPSCPMNFMERDPDTLDSSMVLDADRITDNLARLNLAYCRLTGQERLADKRVALSDLLTPAREID